jgi:hypothetical protein
VEVLERRSAPLWPIFGNLFGRVIRGYLPQAAEQLVAEAEHTPG